MRAGGMATAALDPDIEIVGVGADRARHRGHLPDRDGRVVMCAEHHVAGEAVEQPLLHHHLAAAAILLRGLEDEMHGAVEIPGLRQIARGAEQHGGVAIMPARMHHVRRLRPVLELVRLRHGQRVHIGADADRPGRVAVAQRPHQARARNPARDRDPPGLEPLGHEVAGPVLIEGQFRMAVDVMTPFGHVRGEFSDTIMDGHGKLLKMGGV